MNPTKEDTAAPTEEKAELAKFELMVILVPDMSQEETNKELDKIRKEIKKLKGEIYHEDLWDVRDLAYMIKKFDKGYYAIFYFTLEAGVEFVEMENEFKLNHKIIRQLLVKSPKNYEIKKLEDFMLSEEDLKPKPRETKSKYAASPAVKKVEKKEESKEEEKPKTKPESKPEPKPEVVEEKPKKEEKKAMDISELDSKLESILDDPDIDIKL